MAIEVLRRITDRFFPPIEKRHPGVVVMKPSFFDPKLTELLDEAVDLYAKGEQEASRLMYLEAAALEAAIFESIPTDSKRGIRDRAEYGVMTVSGLVSAHENNQAREFEERLRKDPLIPEDARQRAASLIVFLVENPNW
jgi:hypothetical protein